MFGNYASGHSKEGSCVIRALLLLAGAMTVRASTEVEPAKVNLRIKRLEQFQFREYKFKDAKRYGRKVPLHKVVVNLTQANKPRPPCDYYFVSESNDVIVCHNGKHNWEVYAVSNQLNLQLYSSSSPYHREASESDAPAPEDFKSHWESDGWFDAFDKIASQQVDNYFKTLHHQRPIYAIVDYVQEKDNQPNVTGNVEDDEIDNQPPPRQQLRDVESEIREWNASKTPANADETPQLKRYLTFGDIGSETIGSDDEEPTSPRADEQSPPGVAPSAVGGDERIIKPPPSAGM